MGKLSGKNTNGLELYLTYAQSSPAVEYNCSSVLTHIHTLPAAQCLWRTLDFFLAGHILQAFMTWHADMMANMYLWVCTLKVIQTLISRKHFVIKFYLYCVILPKQTTLNSNQDWCSLVPSIKRTFGRCRTHNLPGLTHMLSASPSCEVVDIKLQRPCLVFLCRGL